MNKKKLLVITSGSYPYGGASTNRHLSYLKGLVELGVEVEMIILQPDKNQSIKSYNNKGVFNGIIYKYVIPIENNNKAIFNKIVRKIKSIKKAVRLSKEIIKKNKKDLSILVLVTDPFEIIPFLKLAKENGIKIFHERTEFPFIGMNSFIKKIKLSLYLKYVVINFDGLFVITKSLKEYFKIYISANRIKHIPMTVEPNRFNCRKYKSNNKYGKYIAYCGSMYTDKDGVPILIKAFDIFAENFPSINLLLIGDNKNENLFKPISDLISETKHKDSIFLTGQVERDSIPMLLCNAEALVLARPNNIQAKGGFPTKLGEYLATGKPVVVTSVGEIPDYIRDGHNGFVSKPDSPEEFAKILLKVFNDREKAVSIGKKGKGLAEKEFNYLYQAKRLKQFIFNE